MIIRSLNTTEKNVQMHLKRFKFVLMGVGQNGQTSVNAQALVDHIVLNTDKEIVTIPNLLMEAKIALDLM